MKKIGLALIILFSVTLSASVIDKNESNIYANNVKDAEYYSIKAEDYLAEIEYYTQKGDLYNAKIYSRYYEHAVNKYEAIISIK